MDVDPKIEAALSDERDLLKTSKDVELVREWGLHFRKQSGTFYNMLQQEKMNNHEMEQRLQELQSQNVKLQKLVDEQNSIQTKGMKKLCEMVQNCDDEKANMLNIINKQQNDISTITTEFSKINTKFTNMWCITQDKSDLSFKYLTHLYPKMAALERLNATTSNTPLTWKSAKILVKEWNDEWAKQYWSLDEKFKQASKDTDP